MQSHAVIDEDSFSCHCAQRRRQSIPQTAGEIPACSAGDAGETRRRNSGSSPRGGWGPQPVRIHDVGHDCVARAVEEASFCHEERATLPQGTIFAMLCGWHWRKQCRRTSFGTSGVGNCCCSSHTCCCSGFHGAGIDVPEWGDVDRGQRPGFHPDDEFPRFTRIGWQLSRQH